MINPVDQSGGFAGVAGFVFARAANIFPPPKRGLFFFVGRVANPPNPENRRSVLGGSGGRSHWGVSLPDPPWCTLVSTTSLALHNSGRIMLEESTPLFSRTHQSNHALSAFPVITIFTVRH